jgi:cell wall-associated NlpC family hydrolase
MRDIQSTLDEFAKATDNRLSVFDVSIQELKRNRLRLSGRLLEERQLDDLQRLFPGLKLDTAEVRILSRHSRGRAHIATNLTGLYEKPTFGMPLSSELCYGTELEILDEENNWVFTRQDDGYLGWTYRTYLGDGPARQATHLVLAPVVEVRAQSYSSGEILTRLVSGTGITLEETRDGWSCVTANKSGWVPSSNLRSLIALPATLEQKRGTMIEDSQRLIGIPYLWGGTSGNGIDCSGFARLLHRWVGVEIPRDADMQYEAARPVEESFEPGDLFFFREKDSDRKITHVGVSLDGWKMIHSSRRNNGVYIDDLQQNKELMDKYVSAGTFLR